MNIVFANDCPVAVHPGGDLEVVRAGSAELACRHWASRGTRAVVVSAGTHLWGVKDSLRLDPQYHPKCPLIVIVKPELSEFDLLAELATGELPIWPVMEGDLVGLQVAFEWLRANQTPPHVVLDIVDRGGRLALTLTVLPRQRLVGFGRRVAFVASRDQDDLEQLRAYVLPPALQARP